MNNTDQQAMSIDAALDTALPLDPVQTPEAVQTPEEVFAEYEPPAYWKNETKEAWKALHGYKEGRPHIEQLHKQWGETTRYLTRVEQEKADLARRYTPINEFLTPYVDQWARQGLDPVGGLRSVLSWRDALQSDPQGTILALAEELGVNLTDAVGEAPYVDPHVSELQKQLRAAQEEMTQFRTQYQQQTQQAQQQSLLQAVQAFEHEQTSDGNLKHPHFREVVNDMLFLYQSGRAGDPEQAYEMAVRLNPEIQAKIAENARLNALKQAQQTNGRTESALAKSGVAKAAPQRGSGNPVSSIDDALDAVFR